MRILEAPLGFSALLTLVLLLAGPTLAANHAVAVGPGFTFSPADLTIAPSDTVTWTWVGGFHSVTSGAGCFADGLFGSGNISTAGSTFTSPMGTYATPGVYEYFCAVGTHCSAFNMKGTVTVTTTPPPSVPAMETWALLATALLMAALTLRLRITGSRRPL